ncbi:class I SAM-dependent methyltransferase [Aliiroseovarius halocynthiae]|uniref:Class I SAM-dependent methyltransferase n=2 Tax=Aliiroseovarius halocynthiae TaxID=985055 RepID=A0A545SYJ2_9RHOB|nr:class I SAM-dependent methyltransferase [Aliiroseovarius halocynthiae]TQV70030.1 class I SAM-dependent methyltransferase [Aliiroseovarius halocynthiae]
MRALGYYDGYLGFLSQSGQRVGSEKRVIDIGCGTGALAEAWVAINGAPQSLTLLDPSPVMLQHAATTIGVRGIDCVQITGLLGDPMPQADEVLAAHVIEHCPDPLKALRDLRDLIAPDGRLRLIVSKPHWCNAIIWLQWRHRTFARAEILELFNQAGLAVDSEYSFPSGPPSRTTRGFVLHIA